jgi:hypothetical protein
MKNSYIGFTAAAAFAALTIACGNQETQVIENFFRAVQAKDTGTMSSFAVVQFDGEVKSWKVKSVGAEERTPAPLANLAKALKDAEEAAAQNKKDASAYFNAHPLEVDKVKPLVENGGKIPANLQKTADDWKKFSDLDHDLKEKAGNAKQAYEREKRLVIMSTGSAGNPDTLAGDVVSKTAVVEIESAGDVKPYAIQLRKYDVAAGGQGAKVMSRWLIYSITKQ